MSDQASSGEPVSAPATPAGAAPVAAASGDRPIGAFGTARGSGLARGKRANTPPTTPAAAPVSSYKPTAVEVITPQREYTNPFASETPAPVPANEPAPQAAPVTPEANLPVTSASEPPAVTAPAAGEPIAAPTEVIQPSLEKAEIKILPPAEAKRPAVSWGDAAQDPVDTRPARESRPNFQPERRERRFEPREPRAFEPREPREQRPFEPRNPDAAREGRPQGERERTFRQPEAAQPKGGFIAWLKGLFGAKPAAQPAQAEEHGNRDGEFHRRRHRGGRGRGGYQGDNRGPREGGQPRPDFQGGNPNAQGGEQGQGERRFEGGGGRRRRRGGRGRFRDDRGPRPEGHQGGGAI